MYKLIKCSEITHFTDLFDKISAIYYVDDINIPTRVFGSLYFETDYSELPDEDLLELDNSELRQITDLYVIYRLNQLRPQDLSFKQKKELARMYRIDPNDLNSPGFRIYMDDSDVARILDMLKEHKTVQGPIYRPHKPNKNFAIKHGLNLGPQDYAYILHNLTVDECRVNTPYKTFSFSANEPGNELLVFNVDKTFELSNGQTIGNFKIYMKIDLSKTINNDNDPIVLVSFHESY